MTTGNRFTSKNRKTIPKYLTKEVIEHILDKAKKDSFRNYLVINTLWKTGLRVSELTNLRKCDIHDNAIFVIKGKGSKDRIVPLEKELDTLLHMWSDRMSTREKLFKIKPRQVRNIVYKYDKSVHPHTFRHSFAVHCLKNGVNLRSLQKLLGHDYLQTTQIYLDIVAKDVRDDFDKVDW